MEKTGKDSELMAHSAGAERSRAAKFKLEINPYPHSNADVSEMPAILLPTLHWNDRGQLARITLLENSEKYSCTQTTRDSLRRDQLEFHFRAPAETARSLQERIVRYCETGEPLGEVPWSAIDFSACTPFQREVYRATSTIPHGETRTYGWVAYRIGDPKCARAVGQALGRNPLPLLFPCHRVVGGSGDLTGFMGEGNAASPEVCLKKKLLDLEASYRSPAFSFAS